MTFALEPQRRLPTVGDALRIGAIDVRRARVIVNTTLHLSIAGARNAVEQIIGDAGLLTTGQLEARIRKLCIEADPDEAQDRYQHAVAERRIVTQPNESGTADLFGMSLPPHRLAAGMQRINQLARGLRRHGETRTMDQLRADVLLDLLEGTGIATRAGRGTVDIHVDLVTLAQLNEHPGDLAGYGPVIADIARQVTQHQQQVEWRWTLTDADTRQPIDNGITRYRPTSSQRRLVQTRNTTCVHPGCRMPATACDIDHRIPWAESHATNTRDLAPLCRYHHTIRHRAGWTYKPLPDGDHQFTTPLGHKYTTSGQPP